MDETHGVFDTLYTNRKSNTFLQRFMKVKLPIGDRDFGSPQEMMCNIYMNLTQDKSTNDLIDEYIFSRRWVYHPVRSFEKWHNISKQYYGNQEDYWAILVFNKISDPFTALEHLSMVRVPYDTFIIDLKTRWDFY
jgi:hypothetical protein